MSGSRRGRFALAALAIGFTAGAWARTGAGNHAVASSNNGGGGFPLGGGSLAGLIVLVVLFFAFRYIMRRLGNGAASSQSMDPRARGAQAVLSALGAAAAAPGLARMGLADLGGAPRTSAALPAIDAIRAVDPGFELETFLQRAEMTFFLVKRGIQKNSATAVRAFLADGLYAAVAQGISQSQAKHTHALLEGLNVRGLAIEEASCEAQGQKLTVHFDLVYRAKMLDDSNRTVSDEGKDQAHAERWTFSRAATARTAQNGGVIASKCPACGAELRLSLDGTCAHCKASVTNGSIDWVVSEVAPASFMGYSADSSLGTAAPTVAAGIATLTTADPAFAIEPFQSRVKSAFLALQDAWCKQNLDAGRAFMSPGAYFSWSAQLETMAAEGRRNVMENLAVQRIEPVRVVHGRVFDDLTVRITAAAADFEVDQSGKLVFGDRSVRPFSEDWTFQRSVGVATANKPGTLENTCPSCGAPIALTQIGECRYCKAAVSSGKFDWVVSRIEQLDAESSDGGLAPIGEAIAVQVGSALVGGVLSSLLSPRR